VAELPFLFARNTVNADDLWSMQDIARESGYSYQYIRSLACGVEKTRPPFPRAYTKVGRSPMWKRDTVWKWIERHGGGK